MGEPRVVHRGVIPALLALALAGCGGEAELLAAAGDVQASIYGDGSAAGDYRPSSMDPGVRGTIRGKVLFKGKPRSPKPHQLSDKFCIDAHAQGLMREDFLVAPDGGLQGVIVYVKQGLSGEKWPVPAEPVVLDQIGCQYVPHVAVVQTGQPLVIKSSDPIMHNVHGGAGVTEFNQSLPNGGQMAPLGFRRQEVAMRVWCDVHGWMEAWVGVLPHPCHAITSEDGSFTLNDVPPGKYLLAAWHEKLGESDPAEVTLGANGTLEHNFTFEGK